VCAIRMIYHLILTLEPRPGPSRSRSVPELRISETGLVEGGEFIQPANRVYSRGTRELKLQARQKAYLRKELGSHGDEPACEFVAPR